MSPSGSAVALVVDVVIVIIVFGGETGSV